MLLFGGLGALLVGGAVASLAIGAVDVPPGRVLRVVLHHLGVGTGEGFSAQEDAIVWSIRLPRLLLGALVGAGLGAAGAALQGVFRNPLADPQLVGVAGGSAFGATAAVAAAGGLLGSLAGPLGGIVGGLAAGAVVYSLARHQGRTEVVTMVLAGIAVAAVGLAGAALLGFAVDRPELRSALFWSLGTISVATWRLVAVTAPFVLVAVAVLPLFARPLDLLLLGDREAHHLGVAVERVRFGVLGLAVLATAAAVSAVGVIGFVGLLAPHAIRVAAGPAHRVVLPGAALCGAVLVVLADLTARSLHPPVEVPVGLITAVVGGPVFLWLLHRTRTQHGGWG
ncbi:MAG: iron ABC transporter permease [Acidimicrobiia bacterium]|nr:iron ABC transporter permease [Acidimicrobiia bacterium]